MLMTHWLFWNVPSRRTAHKNTCRPVAGPSLRTAPRPARCPGTYLLSMVTSEPASSTAMTSVSLTFISSHPGLYKFLPNTSKKDSCKRWHSRNITQTIQLCPGHLLLLATSHLGFSRVVSVCAPPLQWFSTEQSEQLSTSERYPCADWFVRAIPSHVC